MPKCGACKGTGEKALMNVGGKPFKTCPKCKGTGERKGGRPKNEPEDEE